MISLLHWLRRADLPEERSPAQERHDIEKDNQLTPEQRHRPRLSELRERLDSLVACQAYNNRHCHLTSLPGELLLLIAKFLRDANDPISLYCLRSVSRVFYHLTNSRCLWKDEWYSRVDESQLYDWHSPQRASNLEFDTNRVLKELLLRDWRCDWCKKQDCATSPVHGWRGSLHVLPKPSPHPRSDRQFLNRTLCGDACKGTQCYHQSSLWRKLTWRVRLAWRGRQGRVELCEHVGISWNKIQSYLEEWRDRKPAEQQDFGQFLATFRLECQHPSHDARCSAAASPTWPRARLVQQASWIEDESKPYERSIGLRLEWTAHAPMNAVRLRSDGRVQATELRSLFRCIRAKGPADTMLPTLYPGCLPEMAAFEISSRTVNYGDVVSHEIVENRSQTQQDATSSSKDVIQPKRSSCYCVFRSSKMQAPHAARAFHSALTQSDRGRKGFPPTVSPWITSKTSTSATGHC